MKKAIFLLATLIATFGMAQTPQYPMPTKAKFDSDPSKPNSLVRQVLTYAIDPKNDTVPLKTIKITNNTENTVYPMLRDGNEAALKSKTGLYDPYDPVDTEFRGYIGYQGTDRQYYFGLQKGQTITVRIPLVFWNGARMSIVTDGKYLAPSSNPNPLNYDSNATCVITAAESEASSIKNGVIMWYRGNHVGPALDAPDQLVEWTIRDSIYLSKISTRDSIAKSEKTNLINYDVSYVDNMFLPVAMEALDVPIPAPPYPPGKNPAPYGWIGSIEATDAIKPKIAAFTANHNTLLGNYFGGKGWPAYDMPKSTTGGQKIPSGQNIFAQSPLKDTRSSYYNNLRFMLNSADTLLAEVTIGGEETAATGDVLTLSANTDENVRLAKLLNVGDNVLVVLPDGRNNSPIKPGTKILEILQLGTRTPTYTPTKLRIDKPLVAPQTGCTFVFKRPVHDYASDTLIKLWYSWAQYYLNQTKKVQPQTVVGAVESTKATLWFGKQVKGLVEGMLVTGPGFPDPGTGKGGVVILGIAADEKSVTLSQLSMQSHPISEGSKYTFQKPQPIPETPGVLHKFDFSKETPEPAREPLQFAKKIYLVMASMAQIEVKVKTPAVLELMNNVVGGNMGKIYEKNPLRSDDEEARISAILRDMIKSVLRGVTDFTQYPEFDEKNRTQVWYPAPAAKRGGLSFNAFNLDPFVWFVHVQLGFSGYGFSLDDDVSDVGAGQATRLHLTIGGAQGLTNPKEWNPNEWTIQAPYGPLPDTGYWDPAYRGDYLDLKYATNTTPILIACTDHGLGNGDTVIISEVKGNTAANGKFKVLVITKDTFALVGSKGNGTWISGGKWIRNVLPCLFVNPDNVYWKLLGDDKDAGFQGALVTGSQIQQKGEIRVKKRGNPEKGILILNKMLTNADGSPLAKGTYQWIFSGK